MTLTKEHMRCGECGQHRPASQYHPYELCRLYKAGWTDEAIVSFVRRAYRFTNPNGTFRDIYNPSP